jgi:hypothetical protein
MNPGRRISNNDKGVEEEGQARELFCTAGAIKRHKTWGGIERDSPPFFWPAHLPSSPSLSVVPPPVVVRP